LALIWRLDWSEITSKKNKHDMKCATFQSTAWPRHQQTNSSKQHFERFCTDLRLVVAFVVVGVAPKARLLLLLLVS